MGKCISCGFAISRNNSSRNYRLLCTNNGSYKRNGDSCINYWNKK